MSEVTIFPVKQGGKTHAAFLAHEDTDTWFTRCGLQVKDSSAVIHDVKEVECEACADQIVRARNMRETMKRLDSRDDTG